MASNQNAGDIARCERWKVANPTRQNHSGSGYDMTIHSNGKYPTERPDSYQEHFLELIQLKDLGWSMLKAGGHCRDMGCRIRGWHWSWEEWTSPG